MTPEPTPPVRTGRGDGGSLLWLVLLVAAVVWIIDQASKWWAVESLEGHGTVRLIGDLLTLSFLRNPGAAFSLGSGSTVLFTVVAVVVVVVILRTARRLHSAWWAVALGGLLGGALGNLTDRLFRTPGFPSGHVVDFIAVKYFAVFNCADMAIVGSAILMVVLSLLGVDYARRRHAVSDAADEPAAEGTEDPGRGDG